MQTIILQETAVLRAVSLQIDFVIHERFEV
jgi:hypothetical protein